MNSSGKDVPLAGRWDMRESISADHHSKPPLSLYLSSPPPRTPCLQPARILPPEKSDLYPSPFSLSNSVSLLPLRLNSLQVMSSPLDSPWHLKIQAPMD